MQNHKKIAVLFSGQGSNLSYIIEHLHNKELVIAVALTNNPDAKGIAIAKKAGIPVEIVNSSLYEQRELFDAQVVSRLKMYAPELTVLAGFMRILTSTFTTQIEAINLHPSLLPRHKGLHAIERSYADEFATGGVSVHWVSSELDGGEIILQKEIEKKDLDFQSYEKQIRHIEKIALVEAIRVCTTTKELKT